MVLEQCFTIHWRELIYTQKCRKSWKHKARHFDRVEDLALEREGNGFRIGYYFIYLFRHIFYMGPHIIFQAGTQGDYPASVPKC